MPASVARWTRRRRSSRRRGGGKRRHGRRRASGGVGFLHMAFSSTGFLAMLSERSAPVYRLEVTGVQRPLSPPIVFALDRRRGARDDFVTAVGKGAPPGSAATATRRSGYCGGDGLHTESAYHGEGAGGGLDRTGDSQTRWGPRRGFAIRTYADQLCSGRRCPPGVTPVGIITGSAGWFRPGEA
jgi:hypothetical protein